MMTRALLAAALLCAGIADAAGAQAPGADPFVFITDKNDDGTPAGNAVWWLRQAVIRPTGTAVAGVPLTEINKELAAAGKELCFASAFTPRSFVSAHRAVQKDIEESFTGEHAPTFRASGAFTGGAAMDAAVGAYETCDGATGTFLLITERATPQPRVVRVDTFADWRPFLSLRYIDGALVVSTCMMCGHAEGLFYDRARARFYWESLGD